MSTPRDTLVTLETRFWQSILAYRVKQGVAPRDKGARSIQEMNDTSTWIQAGERWKCVMHTETPTA